ncbi:MAG: hypothetical protein R3C39_01300 [Dehalococcoidia bacterium]
MDGRDADAYHAAIGDLGAYLDALRDWQAGAIEVERGEDPGTAYLMLRRAAALLGVHVLTRWNHASQLYWRLDR